MNLKTTFQQLVIFFFLTIIVRQSCSEIFSSMVHLRESVEYVQKMGLIEYLSDYLENHRQIVRTIGGLTSKLADTNFESKIENTEHPISAFKFVWEASTLLDNRDHVVSDKALKLNKSRVLSITAKFPTLSDLHGLGNGTYRVLCHIFRIKLCKVM